MNNITVNTDFHESIAALNVPKKAANVALRFTFGGDSATSPTLKAASRALLNTTRDNKVDIFKASDESVMTLVADDVLTPSGDYASFLAKAKTKDTSALTILLEGRFAAPNLNVPAPTLPAITL